MTFLSKKPILIGSHAIRWHFPDFPREPKDFDFILYQKNATTFTNNVKYEYHWSSAFEWLLTHEGDKAIVSPDMLLTIKTSHAFWDIHWDKTMYDIGFLQSKGAKVNEEFFNLLYKDWESLHGKKNVNLNVNNEDFFGKHIVRKYKHDDLHYALAYYDEPLYNKLKKDKNKAWVDKELFNKLSLNDKMLTCREEIYVTALERHLIPSNFDCNPLIAYRRALKQLIISMTRGWFARFLVDNYSVLKRPDDYFRFKDICKNKGI